MTTDTAQVYKAKLIEINKKISDIEALGFNVANLNKVLNEIIEKYQVSIKKSKNNNFEGFIINDYTNAINELNKLDSALDKYNIYFKAYNYSMYILGLSINESNIDNIREELKKLLNDLRNSSNIDYDDEKAIVESVYDVVYKVICYEIENYNQSEIYNYCNKYETDKLYLHDIIRRELSKIDLFKYPEIQQEIYNIQKEGLNSNYFNIELLRKIIYRDKKEELVKSVKKRTNEILKLHNQNLEQINKLNSDIEYYSVEYQTINRKIKRNYLKILRKSISIFLSISIPFTSYYLAKKSCLKSGSYDKEYYHTIDYVYNSYTDKVVISESEKEEVNSDTKTCILKEYSEVIDASNIAYRNELSYDLSFLGYDDIDDYINYYNSNPNIIPYKEYNVDQKDIDINVEDSYYEVVYKYIDEESKVVETDIEEAKKDALFFTLIILFIIATILGIPFGYNIDCIIKLFDSNKIKKSRIKEIKRVLLDTDKQLLKIIGENEELKLRFNNEVQKYPELINNITLPNKDVKILSKKKM